MQESPDRAPDEKKPDREQEAAAQSEARTKPPEAPLKHLPRPTRR